MTQAWWHSAVVYQIWPRSFADANGDGIGDLAGITAHLDYLAWLGVDVLWLSPVYASPQDDMGYDISNYQDIEPTFGTLGDFDELLAGVHDRGMRLVMDLVVNHTSDEHPWFVESRSSRSSAKRDWYWWRPPREGMEPGAPGAAPTNWASVFSGSAWEFDESSGEYYLHVFTRKQPDLNWENPQVREAVYAMMRWWLDRGVDGFRMDVINFISKEPSLPDGRMIGGGRFADGSPYYIGGPRLHEFVQELHREVFADRANAYLTVGEMPGVTVEEARLFTDPARHEIDMVFHFEHVRLDQVRPSGTSTHCSCGISRRRSGAGRSVSRTLVGTRCTGTTTTNRGRSRGTATTGAIASSQRSCWRRCCTYIAERRMSIKVKRSA